MNSEYKHTQIASLIIYIMVSVILVQLLVIAILSMTLDVEPSWILPVIGGWIMVSLGVCLLLFYKLTVEIKDGVLRFWFGPGLIHKKISLEDIVSCRPVKNKLWHGWGIHFYGGGVLYNVSGFDAVEIELTTGKKLRLGTDEPEKLTGAINNIIINLQEKI